MNKSLQNIQDGLQYIKQFTRINYIAYNNITNKYI